MKKLLFLLLLPIWAFGQTNGTIQKTSATGTVRGSFGALGVDTLTRVTGVLTNGYILKYNSSTNKWYASPDPTGTGVTSVTGTANQVTVTGTTTPVISLPASISGVTNLTPGGDFTITQNSVTPFKSINSGAQANTVVLNAGNIGIGHINPTIPISLNPDVSHIIGIENSATTTGMNLTVKAGGTVAGTNNSGGNLILSSGRSTGNASSSDSYVSFSTATPSGSGTTVNNPDEKGRINGLGNFGLGTIAPVSFGTGYKSLDIRGSNGGGVLFGITGGANMQTYSDASASVFFSTTARPIQFYTNSTLALTISSAQIAAFVNSPTAPTPSANDNSTKVATTAYVDAQAGTSGTYTPTLTNVANITSSSLVSASYIRVGNQVMVEAVVTITPNLGANTATTLDLSLPIASAFSATSNARGGGSGQGNNTSVAASGIVSGDATNDRATFTMYPGSGGFPYYMSIHFQYTVI